VILDNASHHRRKTLRKLARGKVRVLFLPPYSPDYNPIEKSWANEAIPPQQPAGFFHGRFCRLRIFRFEKFSLIRYIFWKDRPLSVKEIPTMFYE